MDILIIWVEHNCNNLSLYFWVLTVQKWGSSNYIVSFSYPEVFMDFGMHKNEK